MAKINYIDKKARIIGGLKQHIELANTPDSEMRNLLVCHHCGMRYTFGYPIEISEFTSLLDHFENYHGNCEKKV